MKLEAIYLNAFSDENDLLEQFSISASDIDGYTVLLASYDQGWYEGAAFVLLEHNESKELFTVYASHCSCYGLEGQFDMEPASIEQIEKLLDMDYNQFESASCSAELRKLINVLKLQ